MLVINKSINKFESIINKGFTLVNNLWTINHNCEFKKCTGTSRNGLCRRLDDNNYLIKINECLVKEDDILEVVIHELLHSYPEVYKDGHKGEWKVRANEIYKKYGIKVQRTNSFEKSIEKTKRKVSRKVYQFNCWECGRTWYYYRKPKWYNRIDECKCPHCKTYSIGELL